MPVFTLHGSRINDIASFYDEINRLFMAQEDWRLGPSLDALDDLLYGGYGALSGVDRAVLVWTDMEASRAALGLAATRRHYLGKLEQPEIYNAARIRADLAQLEAGTGPTYFDQILEVIAGHPNIELQAG